MNLSHKLLLVDLSISMFGARKLDKVITREIAQLHKVDEKAGRYNRYLFPTDPPAYLAIGKAATKASTTHKKLTVPWNDDGCRVLASRAYMDYTTAMASEQANFDAVVRAFEPEYPAIVAESLQCLNGMATPKDYPTQNEIRSRFGMAVKFLPFPTSEDIRVDLPAFEVEAIKANVEVATRAALANSILDPIKRLYDAVKRMANTLSSPDAVFRDSLVSNLEEVRALLPMLNVTEDANLTALFAQSDPLVTHEPDTLRHNPAMRQSIAEKAALLQKQLEGYFTT